MTDVILYKRKKTAINIDIHCAYNITVYWYTLLKLNQTLYQCFVNKCKAHPRMLRVTKTKISNTSRK